MVLITRNLRTMGHRGVPTIDGKSVNNRGPSPETMRNDEKLTGMCRKMETEAVTCG